ncbi:hypothetical protein VTL71DRAFT_4967 [Oculimacula yallundae]|uniref:Uncharacterized protein n=1 Tax=Oculimacula yallundae TaxID=86028 RepID=A0ABR4C3L1_9HELO
MQISLIRAAAPLRAARFNPLPSNCNIHQQHSHPLRSLPSLSTQLSKSLSTRHSLRAQESNTSKPPPPPNPSFGAAPMSELGATSTVKIVVYVAISIMATVETFTWAKFLWAKFGRVEEDEVEAEK